jgi:hypothetical protein
MRGRDGVEPPSSRPLVKVPEIFLVVFIAVTPRGPGTLVGDMLDVAIEIFIGCPRFHGNLQPSVHIRSPEIQTRDVFRQVVIPKSARDVIHIHARANFPRWHLSPPESINAIWVRDSKRIPNKFHIRVAPHKGMTRSMRPSILENLAKTFEGLAGWKFKRLVAKVADRFLQFPLRLYQAAVFAFRKRKIANDAHYQSAV